VDLPQNSSSRQTLDDSQTDARATNPAPGKGNAEAIWHGRSSLFIELQILCHPALSALLAYRNLFTFEYRREVIRLTHSFSPPASTRIERIKPSG
jgi:hypothetical protein